MIFFLRIKRLFSIISPLIVSFPVSSQNKISAEVIAEIISIEIEAGVSVDATYYSADGEEFSFFVSWNLNLDKKISNRATFNGVFDLGDHYVLTKSNGLIGVTRQEFYDFKYLVKGNGSWNYAKKLFEYNVKPTEADNGIASLVSFSKPPTCVKISGIFAGRACKVFFSSSLALEGIELKIRFAEDMKSFKGEGIFIQYGGAGLTESRTQIKFKFDDKLRASEKED